MPPCSQSQARKLALDNKPADTITKFKRLFEPRSVAFLGASSDPIKWGFRILANLVDGGFQGRVYPVNPGKGEILGLKVYESVGDIPETPDLAVIVVPPPSVPRVLKECVDKGIQAGVVVTAGFAEIGEEGERLQQEIVDIGHSGGMILVGPNSFGILNPWSRLYVQMPGTFPPPGPVAVLSQSGNIVETIFRLAMAGGFGCSKCISSGNEADLQSQDYLGYLADDPKTRVILCYTEGFRDGRRFLQTAKEVTKRKPVVMLKAGETPAGARAAKSHTASLAGSDAVFDAMRKQAGVIRARSLDELVDIGKAFLCHPLPPGRRVAIATTAGGWGALAADACAKLGLEVVSLPPETIAELDSFLPAWWNRGNPVDLVAGVFADVMNKCVDTLLRCPVVDAVIMLGVMPQVPPEQYRRSTDEQEKEQRREVFITAVVDVFDHLSELANRYKKPVVAASQRLSNSPRLISRIARTLGERNAVYYDMPHQAAVALASLAEYSEYLRQGDA